MKKINNQVAAKSQIWTFTFLLIIGTVVNLNYKQIINVNNDYVDITLLIMKIFVMSLSSIALFFSIKKGIEYKSYSYLYPTIILAVTIILNMFTL